MRYPWLSPREVELFARVGFVFLGDPCAELSETEPDGEAGAWFEALSSWSIDRSYNWTSLKEKTASGSAALSASEILLIDKKVRHT